MTVLLLTQHFPTPNCGNQRDRFAWRMLRFCVNLVFGKLMLENIFFWSGAKKKMIRTQIVDAKLTG